MYTLNLYKTEALQIFPFLLECTGTIYDFYDHMVILLNTHHSCLSKIDFSYFSGESPSSPQFNHAATDWTVCGVLYTANAARHCSLSCSEPSPPNVLY